MRPLAGVLAALAVSHTGTRVSAVALPWFVLVSSGSAVQTGLVAFAELAPYALAKALAGPQVDRAGPRLVSWSTDLVSAAAVGVIPLLHLAEALPFWLLLLLVAVVGGARGPGDLAKAVMVPEAADRCGVPLERATGLSGVIERLASTVGPAAGGALVAGMGAPAGLAANAVCFALGSLVIAATLPADMGRGAGRERQGPGYWRSLGEGLAFLRADRLLLTVVVMVAVTNLLDAALMSVLLPVWARESGAGPVGLGIVSSAAGMAAVAGSLIAAAIAHRLRRRLVFFAGFLLAGAPRFLILALDASAGLPLSSVVAVAAVSGFGAGFLNPILGAVIYERIPRPLIGRVTGLTSALSWAGMPFGGLVAGAAVAAVGLAPALVVGAAAYFLTTNLTALRPEWRDMDRHRPPARAPADTASAADTS
ncbi:MFS transporter [Streptomyces sp. SBT349]|uniref:MFS transporter n=1 Tax=Streptomyces sp. SBT349 TaxID=1580539 RepID=UPI00066D6EB5|nr:MFS transporter [Streptomyces sp. SBT349]